VTKIKNLKKAEGKGAEHLVNGESVEGEAHLVHWNPKYGSIREALNHQDGCAVVGVFLKEADSSAESPLSPILSRFPTLSKFNEKYIFENDIFNVGNLIPKNSEFICYDQGWIF
jgi:carbonic anhydrase